MSQSSLNAQELNEAIDAFKREAVLLAGLMHQNLPRIYDHFTEGGRWYLVMDFIEGETLEVHHSKMPGGHLLLEEVLNIGIQLCTVLDYLHTRQPPIIFRDLKPANVMLSPGGHLYLIDFGIARHFKPGKAKDTVAIGTVGYAPPEQYGKAQTTSSADIYALGATLHQLLSGNDPAYTPFQFAALQLGHQPGSSELEALIVQMLEMSRDERPVSTATVKQALQSICMQRLTVQISAEQPTKALPALTTITSSPDASQKTKEQWLDEGNVHYNAKRYHEALVAFDRAIQFDPNFANAYNNKGIALRDLKHYNEALAAYDHAIQLDPNFVVAYHNKAFVLERIGKSKGAQLAREKARQLCYSK